MLSMLDYTAHLGLHIYVLYLNRCDEFFLFFIFLSYACNMQCIARFDLRYTV